MTEESIVIVAAKRIPTGSFQGVYQSLSSIQLGAAAIKGALEAAEISGEDVDEALMGCVLPAGLGQAPARQAALHAGLPKKVACVTLNKVCGSGLKTVMVAHDLIKAGSINVAIAGGMESMTNAPYLLPGARAGLRMGTAQILDHMLLDGLEDSFTGGTSMGVFAERTAEKYGFTREEQDAFAIETDKRALEAMKKGYFKEEIVPVEVIQKKETMIVDEDEPPKKINFEKIPLLKSSFSKEGTVTPANSSSISDGAAAVVVMKESEAKKRNLKPLARIVAHAQHSREPEWFTLAPSGAIEKVLKKAGWDKDEVDFYEINEAFAVVVMAVMKDLGLSREKVNVHGGACALGHPLGATGAKLLTTLLYALKTHGKKKGVVALCIGGGEAVAMAVERID
ncbi:MAG: thiolase family protein [Alphaproteobacteria bacterium]|nr:thiolase family protein [Alphaproteobacteria bacterium]